MKVTGVSVLIHNRPAPPTGIHPPGSTIPLGVLSIETDSGLVGNSFVTGYALQETHTVAQQIITYAKPLLMGKDPLLITQHWEALMRLNRTIKAEVLGCVDVALWDLAGKAANMPVHRMLGTVREKIPAYLSSWVLETQEQYLDEASHYQALGWQAYKPHPLTQLRNRGVDVPIDADIRLSIALRERVGDSMGLMMDSAWAYDYREALTVGRALDELDYLWFEDPLKNSDDIYHYQKLREKLDVPILATEVLAGGVFAYPAWIQNRATDILRGDPLIKGGITGMMKIAHLAEAYRMNCEIHDSYTAHMNVAALHLSMAISNTTMFEVLSINVPGQHDLSNFSYGLHEPMTVDAEGFIHAPVAPGLSYELDWERLRSDVAAELS